MESTKKRMEAVKKMTCVIHKQIIKLSLQNKKEQVN